MRRWHLLKRLVSLWDKSPASEAHLLSSRAASAFHSPEERQMKFGLEMMSFQSSNDNDLKLIFLSKKWRFNCAASDVQRLPFCFARWRSVWQKAVPTSPDGSELNFLVLYSLKGKVHPNKNIQASSSHLHACGQVVTLHGQRNIFGVLQ